MAAAHLNRAVMAAHATAAAPNPKRPMEVAYSASLRCSSVSSRRPSPAPGGAAAAAALPSATISAMAPDCTQMRRQVWEGGAGRLMAGRRGAPEPAGSCTAEGGSLAALPAWAPAPPPSFWPKPSLQLWQAQPRGPVVTRRRTWEWGPTAVTSMRPKPLSTLLPPSREGRASGSLATSSDSPVRCDSSTLPEEEEAEEAVAGQGVRCRAGRRFGSAGARAGPGPQQQSSRSIAAAERGHGRNRPQPAPAGRRRRQRRGGRSRSSTAAHLTSQPATSTPSVHRMSPVSTSTKSPTTTSATGSACSRP